MASAMTELKSMFRAFKNRNYRLFFIGQGLSFTGMWMQQVALGWLVYKLTNSTLMLGLVAFAGLFPSIFTAPIAGLICDRFDKRKIIIAADIVLALSAFVLAVLAFMRVINPWHIIAINAVIAAAGGFEMTTRHSFVPEIVEKKEDLVNAISMNSAMFNGARLIGPMMAGIIVAFAGEGACFMAYGLGNIAAISAMLMMKTKTKKTASSAGTFKDLAEGAKYIINKKPVLNSMIVLALTCLFGMSCYVLLPVVARDILKGGPDTLGILMGSMGAGAVIGAFFLATRKKLDKMAQYTLVFITIFGLSLIATFFVKNLIAAAIALAFGGFGMIAFMAANNTTIQSLAEDRIRGRVTGFYIISFSATSPLGSLFAGWLARIWGAPVVFLAGGILMLAVTVWFYLFVLKDTKKSLIAAGKIRPAAVIEEI
jgi:MFS family permease